MTEKRSKGRPALQDGEIAGRDRLVQAARTIMQKRPRVDLPRRELALDAGLTPGLVTYHFPTELSLVKAVAQPVIDSYLERLDALLARADDPRETFRQLVLLFLEISRENGQLLDRYIDFVKSREFDGQPSFLAAAFTRLAGFMAHCERVGFIRPINPAVTQSFLWGACKTIAQSEELATIIRSGLDDEAMLHERQADLILDILIGGLRSVPGDRAA